MLTLALLLAHAAWVLAALAVPVVLFGRRAFARDTFLGRMLGRMLGERLWFRRWAGGHWERWWVDVVHADLWHAVDECSRRTGERPTAICRGTPRCEHWPVRRPRGPTASRPLLAALCLVLLGGGCVPLPALVTEGQVRASLAPEQVEAGLRCAARLNGHVRGARASGIARPVALSAGAVLAGTGVALREALPDASLPLAAAGAIVGLVVEVLVRVIADPVDLLRRHALGLASLDAARADGEDPMHLENCVRDEAPRRARMAEDPEGRAP